MPTYPITRKRLTALISATKILSSTCQLFLIGGNSKRPHGCTVLVTFNSKYYCLSNSHVFNKGKFPNVYMLTRDNEYVLLEGGLMYSEPSFGDNINNDTFDVGIMELTQQVKEKFFGFTFLELDQIETSVTLLRNNVTMIAAYPASKTKFDSKTNASLSVCSGRRISIWIFVVNFNFIFSIGQGFPAGRYKISDLQQYLFGSRMLQRQSANAGSSIGVVL